MTLVASDMRRPGEPLVAGARPVRSTSPHAKKAASTDSHTLRRWLLASRLYSITLGYASPKSFFAVAPDAWPGNAAIGQRLLLGELLARSTSGAVVRSEERRVGKGVDLGGRRNSKKE